VRYFRTFRSRRQQASGSRVPRQINGQGAGCQERRHLLNGNHILPRSGAHRKTQPSGCTHGLHNSAHLIESVMATLHGPLMGLVMVMMKKEIYLIYYYAYIFSYWIKMYCILSTKFYIKMCESIKSNLLQTASISNYIAYFPARAPHFPARPQAVEHSWFRELQRGKIKVHYCSSCGENVRRSFRPGTPPTSRALHPSVVFTWRIRNINT